MPPRLVALLCSVIFGGSLTAAPLVYAPAPVDNPLKGFIPYLAERPEFPHSMEWDHTSLADVMTGPDRFDWTAFERKLEAASSRGHHFYGRFHFEWPGKKTGVPAFLIDAGLLMRRWTNTNTQPLPPAVDHTPDYEDPRLRSALTNFIHALGQRYDGDPRLGFLGLGLLGTWGEWHNYPNGRWFASKTVQREVMDAYAAAFKVTRLVTRYPAGPGDPVYAENGHRAFGYHDDSFCWATVETGRKQDAWFFGPRLRQAGALDKWRTQVVGGEMRPEVWECLFNEPGCAPKGQEFDRCLAVTHASWISNEGVFRPSLKGKARERALQAARQLGYELHVASAEVASGTRRLTVKIENRGVAPFYYDWPVEITTTGPGTNGPVWRTDWKLTEVQPGSPVRWGFDLPTSDATSGERKILLRVPNRLPKGRALRFANPTQDSDLPGWLTLGTFSFPPP